MDDAVLILQKSTVAAATALRRCLASDHEGTRVRAAQVILSLAIEVNGLMDMADDLADLNLKIDAVIAAQSSPPAPRSSGLPPEASHGDPRGGLQARGYGTEGAIVVGKRADGPGRAPGTTLLPPADAPRVPGGGVGGFSSADLGAIFDEP